MLDIQFVLTSGEQLLNVDHILGPAAAIHMLLK